MHRGGCASHGARARGVRVGAHARVRPHTRVGSEIYYRTPIPLDTKAQIARRERRGASPRVSLNPVISGRQGEDTHGAFDALSGVTLAAVSRILLLGCLLVTRAYKSESSTLYPHYVQLRTEIDSSSLGRPAASGTHDSGTAQVPTSRQEDVTATRSIRAVPLMC